MKLDINHLKYKINEINEKYPNINYGGCGTFSYYLYKVLKEKYDVNTEIVYVPSPNPPGLKPDYDVKFSHILVKIGDEVIDNNGFHQYSDMCVNLPFEKLEEMVGIPELWNNRFNHQVKNELIKDIYQI